MPINTQKNPIYESYSMFHPDGTLMCFCNEKKAMWYIDRDLATWTGEKTFKLKFAPKGHGKSHSDYYTQNIENRCVVCGVTDHLTKHHVVPYVFRSRFPVEYKESNHHDVLPVCVNCHEHYEGFATRFKMKLSEDIGVDFNTGMSPEQKNNKKILSAQKVLSQIKEGLLLDKEGNSITLPAERLEYLEQKSSEALVEDIPVSGAVWADAIIKDVLSRNQLFEFIKLWRAHFLEISQPQYLPQHWSVDHPLESSNRAKRSLIQTSD